MPVILAAIKSFFLSIMTLMSPYVMDGIIKVAIPVLSLSLQAVLTGDAARIKAAKEEVKTSWGKYVEEARKSAGATPSKIDDIIYNYLQTITMDDAFIGQIFDLAVKLEKQLFRIP